MYEQQMINKLSLMFDHRELRSVAGEPWEKLHQYTCCLHCLTAFSWVKLKSLSKSRSALLSVAIMFRFSPQYL